MLTLIIAVVAAVVAAVVVSHFWQSGTLWATAMTPVIVALVKEGLERPAQRISSVTSVPSRLRQHPDDLVVEEVEPGPAPSARPQPAGYKAYGLRPKHWRLALLTGLLAFVLGALILTVPELVAGRSIVHSGKETSLFGGKSRSAKHKATQQTQTQTQTVTTTVPSTSTSTTPAQTTPTTPQNTTTAPQTTPTTPQNTTTTPPAQTTPTTPGP